MQTETKHAFFSFKNLSYCTRTWGDIDRFATVKGQCYDDFFHTVYFAQVSYPVGAPFSMQPSCYGNFFKFAKTYKN
jgi:hypothetical protein